MNVEQVVGFALPKAEILLPIGISFYTFQLVSRQITDANHVEGWMAWHHVWAPLKGQGIKPFAPAASCVLHAAHRVNPR